MARSCATREDSNKDNVCTPITAAGINRPPPSRPFRIYPECRAYETRLVCFGFCRPGALTFGYGCSVHVGVDVRAEDIEVDVIYITFIMSAQYTGYLVLYKVRYNWITDVVFIDTGFRQGGTESIPL